MKLLLSILVFFTLFSCVDENKDDLQTFIKETSALTPKIQNNLPDFKNIEALAFASQLGRDPFTAPQTNHAIENKQVRSHCPQPNQKRKKEELERYSLNRFSMRGTILINNTLFALLQVAGGKLYSVKKGAYLGFNQGEIFKISKTQVELKELIIDNTGCWRERNTRILLRSE